MSPLATLLWVRRRMSYHTLVSVGRQSKLKVIFVFLSTCLLLYGIYKMSRLGFQLFEVFGNDAIGGGQLSLGDVIMARLLSVFALMLLMMLTFSNLLVVFQTFYRSRDVPFLLLSPISNSTYFFSRFVECVSFSSWASAFLGAPIMLAYGLETNAPWSFYVALPLFYFPFVAIPAALGSMLVMVLVHRLGKFQKGPWLAGGLVVLTALFAYFRTRLHLPSLSDSGEMTSLIEAMAVTQSPWLPSYWVSQGVLQAATGRVGEAAFYFLLLAANAALLVWLAEMASKRWFYSGYATLYGGEHQRSARRGRGPLAWLDVLLSPLPDPLRSLVIKDIRMFWRDSAQWSQFILFFGILALYIANLRALAGASLTDPLWQAWRTLLNSGAAMLILASLTTRFIYPLISLEGRRFWILGLAPLTRRQILFEKFWLSVGSLSVFTVGLALFSAYQLRLDAVAMSVSVFGTVASTFGLSGLAVGLGSLYPNFKEDNPSRIVSGMGGTLSFIISMIYILLMLAVQGVVFLWAQLEDHVDPGWFPWVLAGAVASLLILSLAAAGIPLSLGLRSLERTEL